jgi:hypothetical protein
LLGSLIAFKRNYYLQVEATAILDTTAIDVKVTLSAAVPAPPA